MAGHIANPAGALAEDAQYGPSTQDVIAANSVSKNELVALSTSPGYVIRNLVATAAGIQFGVASFKDIASGAAGTVVVGGWTTVKKGTAAITAGQIVGTDPTVSGAVGAVTAATAVTQAKDVRGFVGTAVADASAAATTVNIVFGKF